MSNCKCWGLTEDGRIEFQTLSDETLEGALDLLRKSFFLYESISVGVELTSEPGASEELEELCRQAAKDGVSVVGVEIGTNKVVGVAFNKIQVPTSGSEKSFFERFSDNCKYKSSKYLIDIMVDIDSRINLFKQYNVDCILEIMFLGTMVPAYGKRGIGEMLVASSLELGKELRRGKNVKVPVTVHGSNKVTNANAVPTLASAIMTSNYSYRIAMKLHFDQLLEVRYEEFKFNGKKLSEKIGQEHRRWYLVAKKLTSI